MVSLGRITALTKVAALAGKACEIIKFRRSADHDNRLRTLAIAGPKPFHSAATPSAAMVLRMQSKKPEYVPVGAVCMRDLMVWDRKLMRKNE